ncbi:MAG: putative oxidoreductase, partial [Phycisphaerales bacterium]|nr:putative oxidoreductase [Phycisphaerales bacterium]
MQIRWGILSTGNIARQFANGLRNSRTGQLQSVGSRSAESAEAFGQQFGAKSFAASYEALIADPNVDAVYNALPNSMHHEWTIKALRAGKHVLCEKPLAVTAAEAEEIFAVAKQTSRVLIEAFMYRCHPQTLAVVDAIKGGAIGKLRSIRTSFCFRTTKIDGNIRFDAGLAGGALMDVGCYCLSFSRLIAGGEPIDAFAFKEPGPGGVDVAISGGLLFAGGVTASFNCAMHTQSDNAALICGDEGWIRIPVPWKPSTATSGYSIERQTPPKQDNTSAGKPPIERITVPVEGDVYGIEADAFSDVVAGKVSPFVTEADSIGNLRLIERLHAGPV